MNVIDNSGMVRIIIAEYHGRMFCRLLVCYFLAVSNRVPFRID